MCARAANHVLVSSTYIDMGVPSFAHSLGKSSRCTPKNICTANSVTHNTASLKRTFVNVIAERKQPYILANMYDEYIQMETVPAVRNVDMLECVTIPGSVPAAQNKENDTLHACFTMYGSY